MLRLHRVSQVWLVLLVFSAFSVIRFRHVEGFDLKPSYYGALVLSRDRLHLYARNHVTNRVSDPVWNSVAAGDAKTYTGPPYVQTPLWAWFLQPLCKSMPFRPFMLLFLAMVMACLSTTIFLVARFWAPGLFQPARIALVCLLIYFTEAFQHAIALAQTHMIFVLLTVAALLLAKRGQGVTAGILLAFAAAVKITPAFLLIYLLSSSNRKAAFSFMASSAAIFLFTVAVLGKTLVTIYIRELLQFSSGVMVAFNNQSYEAWWMGRNVPFNEYFEWVAHPASASLKLGCFLTITACNILGGFLDHQSNGQVFNPPFGAIFSILAATVFSSIAWSHYALILVIPLMLIVDSALAKRSRYARALLAFACVIYALNVYPLSYREVLMHSYHLGGHTISLLRSQFYSILLAMAAMLLLAFQARASRTQSLRPALSTRAIPTVP